MTPFHLIIGGAIALGLLLAVIAYLRNRKLELTKREKLTSIDDEDFDGEVGEEFPDGNLPRRQLYDLDMDNFEQEKAKIDLPIVIEFYADWCSACRTQIPLLEQAAHKLYGKARFFKVDHDQFNPLLHFAGVKKIPTTFFINPKTRTQIAHVGVLSVEEIGGKLDELANVSLGTAKNHVTEQFAYVLDYVEEL